MAAAGDVAVRMLISGRVQGVGFRYFTRRAARRLGLTGWVKNLLGGEVELRVAGPPASLDALRTLLRQGPPGARVDRLDETGLAAPVGRDDFEILY